MRNTFEAPSALFDRQPAPFADSYLRRCLRVLRMVGILHGKGFHGLRVFPYEYPAAYRIELYPGTYAQADGVRYAEELIPGGLDSKLVARHTSAYGAEFFGWKDVKAASAHELALLFIQRFPDLCGEAYYLDYAYAGWFATLLSHCEYGFMPYLFAEYDQQVPGAIRMRAVEGEANGFEYFPSPPTTAYGHRFQSKYSPGNGALATDFKKP